MKQSKRILLLSIAVITAILLCSCSRSSMRSASNAAKNTTRRAENFIENGINDINRTGTNYNYGSYGANNNYSGNTATGTNSTMLPADGKAAPILPTIRAKKSNIGQINTNKGYLDGGMR